MMGTCELVTNLREFKAFCKIIFMGKNYIKINISGLELHSKDRSTEQWQQYEISRWKLTLSQGLLLSCHSSMRLNVGQLTLPVMKILQQASLSKCYSKTAPKIGARWFKLSRASAEHCNRCSYTVTSAVWKHCGHAAAPRPRASICKSGNVRMQVADDT